MNKELLENYFEENGVWHMKDKDGKCKPFLMKDLEELIEQEYQKGYIKGQKDFLISPCASGGKGVVENHKIEHDIIISPMAPSYCRKCGKSGSELNNYKCDKNIK